MDDSGYRVSIKRKAEAELAALPKDHRDQIIERIRALSSDPRPHGVQKLQGADLYRLRSGRYRIIYDIDDSGRLVDILIVRHRREVYRALKSL